MATALFHHPLTREDLRDMPDDGRRYEIINGELSVSPSPNRAHQRLSVRLFRLLDAHVQQYELGEVLFAPVDVRLGPHDIVEPDILFLSAARRDLYQASGVIEGPPDLVVEIVSPASASTDMVRKAALYARAGVREYWIADPASRTFRMLKLEADVYRDIPTNDGRVSSLVIQGLAIEPDSLYTSIA